MNELVKMLWIITLLIVTANEFTWWLIGGFILFAVVIAFVKPEWLDKI